MATMFQTSDSLNLHKIIQGMNASKQASRGASARQQNKNFERDYGIVVEYGQGDISGNSLVLHMSKINKRHSRTPL